MIRRRAYLGLVATGVGGIAGVAPGAGHSTRSAQVTQLTPPVAAKAPPGSG